MKRLQCPSRQWEQQHLAASVMQGTALLAALMAGGVAWRSMHHVSCNTSRRLPCDSSSRAICSEHCAVTEYAGVQWRHIDTLADLRKLCAERSEGWWLRVLVAPVVQTVTITDVGEALTAIPARVFSCKGVARSCCPHFGAHSAVLHLWRAYRCSVPVCPRQT